MVIETGLPCFHKKSITVIKMHYSKPKPTIIHYCKFINFVIKDLMPKSYNEEAITYELLRQLVNVTLEKHASSKARYGRASIPTTNVPRNQEYECLDSSEDPVLKITEKISTQSKY